MSLGIYKPGQGYWARLLTAIGVLALTAGAAQWLVHLLLAGAPADWLHTHFAAAQDQTPAAIKAAHEQFDARAKLAIWVALPLLTALPAVAMLLFHARWVDFLIATETEMKKVAWPDRKTLLTMTGVVIGGLLGLAALVTGIDITFRVLFQLIHIL